MVSVLSALGWVVLYWVCWVALAFVAFGVVAGIGILLMGDERDYDVEDNWND
jgi:hypothetical protein